MDQLKADTWRAKLSNFKNSNLSLLVEKNNQIIFQSTEGRIKPLYQMLYENREGLNGATVIDKIVGSAAAYLCIVGNAKLVLTPIASKSAIKILENYNIPIKALKIVEQIMNKDNTDLCPMEKMSKSFDIPQDFYQHLLKNIFNKQNSI